MGVAIIVYHVGMATTVHSLCVATLQVWPNSFPPIPLTLSRLLFHPCQQPPTYLHHYLVHVFTISMTSHNSFSFHISILKTTYAPFAQITSNVLQFFYFYFIFIFCIFKSNLNSIYPQYYFRMHTCCGPCLEVSLCLLLRVGYWSPC